MTALALLVVLLISGATTRAAGPANVGECAPGLGIALLQVPQASVGDPRARNYVIDAVHPGASFSRTFKVCNGTHQPMPISLYPDAAAISKGAFVLEPGRGRSELTSWITINPGAVTVAPGKSAVATMHLVVPIDATAGERYGGLVADAPAVGNGGLAAQGRVAIRVYLDVTEGGEDKSDFTVDTLQAVRGKDGRPAVLAQVHNTGARALDMTGSLQLSEGPGGLAAGPFPAALGTTLKPGDSLPVVVPLDEAIRGGPWRAVITMKSGILERRAEGRLTFPDKASTGTAPVPVKQLPLYERKSVVVPFAAIFIGVLALLLLLLALREWRRRRQQGPEPTA